MYINVNYHVLLASIVGLCTEKKSEINYKMVDKYKIIQTLQSYNSKEYCAG